MTVYHLQFLSCCDVRDEVYHRSRTEPHAIAGRLIWYKKEKEKEKKNPSSLSSRLDRPLECLASRGLLLLLEIRHLGAIQNLDELHYPLAHFGVEMGLCHFDVVLQLRAKGLQHCDDHLFFVLLQVGL